MDMPLDAWVKYLNEILADDPDGLQDLINLSVPYRGKDSSRLVISTENTFGVMGVINGFISRNSSYRLAAVFDNNGKLTNFIRVPFEHVEVK